MTEPKWYDVTIPRQNIGKQDLATLLDNLDCEKWVIGEEIGKNGYEHWQVRYVLNSGSAWEEQMLVWSMFKGHVTPTKVRNFKYVEKEQNYIASWEKALEEFREIKLKSWQGSALAGLKDQNDREIMVIVDQIGGNGKTYLAKHMTATHTGVYIPPLGDGQEYMAMVMAKAIPDIEQTFIFDVPRAETLKQKKGMWSAVEQVKNGYLYDKRYKWQEMWIKPPKILVFANEEPPYESLSDDRWKVYKIAKMGKLDYLEEIEYEDF